MLWFLTMERERLAVAEQKQMGRSHSPLTTRLRQNPTQRVALQGLRTPIQFNPIITYLDLATDSLQPSTMKSTHKLKHCAYLIYFLWRITERITYNKNKNQKKKKKLRNKANNELGTAE